MQCGAVSEEEGIASSEGVSGRKVGGGGGGKLRNRKLCAVFVRLAKVRITQS